MSVVNYTDFNIDVQDRVKTIIWEGLTDGDTGKPTNLGMWSDKTVQIYYVSGSGATIVMQGSNDPRANPKDADHANAVWETLTDNLGNNISCTTNDGFQAMENYERIRPTVTGGSSPVVNISIHMKRTL